VKERIARSVFWLVWSRGVVQAVSFLSTLAVARMLSPADYGLMALAAIWTSTLALVTEFGLSAAVIQFPDLEEGELNFCFWMNIALASAGYAALWTAAPAIAAWFSTPKLSSVLRVVGWMLPLTALRLVPEGLMRKRLEIDKVSKAEVAGTLVTIPVVLWLAWRGVGVWALVAGTLVLPLVQMFAVFWLARWRPGLHFHSTRLRALLRFGLGSLGARVSWAAYDQLDIVVLGKVGAGVFLGFYSMAKTLVKLPVVKISVVVNQLALPVMAELQTDRGALRASFLRGLRFVACLTVPACVGAMLVADDLVPVVLGMKWQPMVPLLRVLAIFGLVHSLDVLIPPILFARYRPAFMFRWTMALLVVMLFAFWAGAAWRGALGVALAWIIVYPAMVVWMAREGLQELEMGWGALGSELRPIGIAALMMAAGVLLAQWMVPGASLADRLARLALSTSAGALAYGAGILWWGGPLRGELAEVAGWLLPRRRLIGAKMTRVRAVPESARLVQ
jgi:O-antigen/teichoic acid export membrane protein